MFIVLVIFPGRVIPDQLYPELLIAKLFVGILLSRGKPKRVMMKLLNT